MEYKNRCYWTNAITFNRHDTLSYKFLGRRRTERIITRYLECGIMCGLKMFRFRQCKVCEEVCRLSRLSIALAGGQVVSDPPIGHVIREARGVGTETIKSVIQENLRHLHTLHGVR